MNWWVVWLIGNTQLAIAVAIAAFVVSQFPSLAARRHSANDANRSPNPLANSIKPILGKPSWNSIAHLLWVFVLIKLLCPPITWWTAAVPVPSTSLVPVSSVTMSLVNDSVSRVSEAGVEQIGWRGWLDVSMPRFAWVLITVWTSGSMLLIGWIIASSRRIHHLIKYRGRYSVEANEVLRRVTCPDSTSAQSAIDDETSPEVWLIDAVASPMLYSPPTLGWRRQDQSCGWRGNDLILFPRQLWQQLDWESRCTLLRHEYAHWQRRDHWVRKLEMVAMVLLWWHPLIWIAKRQIENCEERCCDAIATARMPSLRRPYAEAILKTLDFLCERTSEHISQARDDVRTRPLATGVGRLPRLEKRLRQILQPNELPSNELPPNGLNSTMKTSDESNRSIWRRSVWRRSVWGRSIWIPVLIITLLPVSPLLTIGSPTAEATPTPTESRVHHGESEQRPGAVRSGNPNLHGNSPHTETLRAETLRAGTLRTETLRANRTGIDSTADRSRSPRAQAKPEN